MPTLDGTSYHPQEGNFPNLEVSAMHVPEANGLLRLLRSLNRTGAASHW